MKTLTRWKVEGLRSELFHMILFAMAWVMIGEYSLDFQDYAVASILVLISVVWLAIYSIKLYQLEESLPDESISDPDGWGGVREIRRAWLFALIFVLEGIAILVTWMMLLKLQREYWLVPCFALIAGLHFFPLARVIRHHSYYLLGAWICAAALAGYFLSFRNVISIETGNTLISYCCAAGAIGDGFGVVVRTRKLRRMTSGG